MEELTGWIGDSIDRERRDRVIVVECDGHLSVVEERPWDRTCQRKADLERVPRTVVGGIVENLNALINYILHNLLRKRIGPCCRLETAGEGFELVCQYEPPELTHNQSSFRRAQDGGTEI